jgi:HAD superfamily hydrolase (TIGR01509 family)
LEHVTIPSRVPDWSPRCLALDAMGVLFAAADDVAELLIPFIRSTGGERDARAIESAYLEASLGNIDADSFWTRVGLDPTVENAYLSQHRLSTGALEFLISALRAGLPVWCLSNDVARWSRRLRQTFGLEPLLAGAVISSDARTRKPDRGIYERLLTAAACLPSELLFVDDRAKNVAAAEALGIRAIRFTADYGYAQLATDLFEKGRHVD